MSELTALLAAEQAVLAAARAGAAQLPDELSALPRQAAARVRALQVALGAAGGAPPPPPEGAVGTGSKALADVLQRAIAAAYAAVQTLDDPKTLRVVGRVMAGDGQSLALLRQAMNQKPVPSAFETGKAP